MYRTGFRSGLLAFLPLLAVLQSGCGDAKMAQVSGRVQYKGGQPLDGEIRVIRFQPADDTQADIVKAASGTIEPDGTFQLYTRKPGDGVFLGKYTVTFTVLKSLGGPQLIQPRYTSPSDTPYLVEVTGDMKDLVYEVEPK